MFEKYKLINWVWINEDILLHSKNAILDRHLTLLSSNPNAIDLLKQYKKRIDWFAISRNPNAIDLLKENKEKIDWTALSSNPNLNEFLNDKLDYINKLCLTGYFFQNPNNISLIEKILIKYPEKVDWYFFSANPHPKAIEILKKNENKINWVCLSRNSNAIEILEKNQDKINWKSLSLNPNAIELLEKNQDKICWENLSANINAIELLEKNQDKINWICLSSNPNAMRILEKNQDKIYWGFLSKNPSAIELLEKNKDKIYWPFLCLNPAIFYKSYDYDKIKERCNLYKEELIMCVFSPKRVEYLLDTYYNGNIELFDEITTTL